ncbi:MAG TPA: hypothetical protein VNK24_07210 [Elusimicrobiota bacterium]|nr:hypothetical protein [Elusimicrobiota bacterium]
MTAGFLLLAGILIPLLAMKAGITVLEKSGDLATIKAVSASFFPGTASPKWIYLREIPVLPLTAGFFCSWAAACALSLPAARFFAGFRDAGASRLWLAWAYAAPMAFAGLLLYFPELRSCEKKSAGLGRWTKAPVFLGALGLTALWGPALGLAFLLHAFYLLDRRRDCPDCDKAKGELWSEPKPWLWLGVMGLCGLAASLERPGARWDARLSHAALLGICGAGLGVLSIFGRIGLALYLTGRQSGRQS